MASAPLCRRGGRNDRHTQQHWAYLGVPEPEPEPGSDPFPRCCSLRQPYPIKPSRGPDSQASSSLQDPWIGGLTSCSSIVSLACYSDRPGPPSLFWLEPQQQHPSGSTAHAGLRFRQSGCVCVCVFVWPHGSPMAGPMGLVIPGIFGPNLALLGDYPWPAWRAASKLEHPRRPFGPLGKLKITPLCCPGDWRSRTLTPRGSSPPLCLLGAGDRCTCSYIRLLWPCGPAAFRPCGGGHLTGLLQGAPAQERWLGACRTATSRKTAQMLRALAHRRSASLSALFFLARQCVSMSTLPRPVLRGRLTLGNWLILALCTSIRHRRVSKTLPSSASVVVGNNMMSRASGPRAAPTAVSSHWPCHMARGLACVLVSPAV